MSQNLMNLNSIHRKIFIINWLMILNKVFCALSIDSIAHYVYSYHFFIFNAQHQGGGKMTLKGINSDEAIFLFNKLIISSIFHSFGYKYHPR